jgi:2'-5' RNA ligase
VRLFAAVDLSPETRDAMAAEQKRIKSSLGSAAAHLKWVRPDKAHLTLVFLGAVHTDAVPRLVTAMSQDIDLPAFDITFSGQGVFPGRGAPRVLWAGIGAGIEQLRSLQREVATRVATHGVALEARDFHPHLTLGRWTGSRPSDAARAVGDKKVETIARENVARVTLFESRLSSSGASYTALAHANLTGR